MLTNENKETK